jgi:hypothetical protein
MSLVGPAHAGAGLITARAPAGADAMELLSARGAEETRRRSIAGALAVIDVLDERIAPLHEEPPPFAAAGRRFAGKPRRTTRT